MVTFSVEYGGFIENQNVFRFLNANICWYINRALLQQQATIGKHMEMETKSVSSKLTASDKPRKRSNFRNSRGCFRRA